MSMLPEVVQKADQSNGDLSKVELVQDDDSFDPRPFKFRPVELASLLDPKSLDILEGLGGIDGLLEGLGTHDSRGSIVAAPASSDGRPGAGVDMTGGNTDPYSASMEDRWLVFGENLA
ncbi:hypothetical protein DFH29DRAFT_1007229 [Suillus ampliporus]|nr:hypothetical protein DFH29DRAFT_1007229 [Suillus ampliporus]